MGRTSLSLVALGVAVVAAAVALLVVSGDPLPDDGAPEAPRDAGRDAGPRGVVERRHVDRDSGAAARAYCDVLREDGQPAERATVVVIRPEGPAEHLVTDVAGRAVWSTPPEGTTVFAVREGEACSRDVRLAGEERIVLRLGPGSGVEGTVRWDDGTAAADVIVDMSLWRSGYTTRWTTRTDRAGRYAFRGVPPAARVQPQVRHVVDCVPVGDTPLRDAAGWGETTTADLVARRPGFAYVNVDVVLPDGAPAPESWSVLRSAAAGVGAEPARRSYDAATRRLRAYVPSDVETILRLHAGELSGEVGPFTAVDGEELTLVARVHADPRLELTVTTPAGLAAPTDGLVAHLIVERDGELEPLGGRAFGGEPRLDVTGLLPMLTALGARGVRLHVVLDGPGVARGGLASDRGANLTRDGFDLARLLSSGGRVALAVPLHASLSATILTVDATGRAVPDVDVDLIPANGFSPAHVRTGPDGRAAVDVLLDTSEAERESGWKRAIATASGAHRGRARLEAPDSPQATPVWSVTVVPLRTYRVRVVDESGAAVAGGYVEFAGWERGGVDAQGRVTLSLRPGEPVAYVGEGLDSADVEAPGTGDEIVLVATPLVEVVVRVVTTGIAPHPDTVRVRVTGPTGMSASTHSLVAEPAELRIALRGMRGVRSVHVHVATIDGAYAGSAETAPGADPVTIVLAATE